VRYVEIGVAEAAEDVVTEVAAPKDKVKAKSKRSSILLLYLGDRIHLPQFRGVKNFPAIFSSKFKAIS
jgi:hypothetical protein